MRARYRILAIVEGHGEVRAVPELLRRWFEHRGLQNFEVDRNVIRAPGSSALKHPHDPDEDLGIECFVELGAATNPDGILVMLDADDDCPKELGPALRDRARAAAPHIPIEVVIANREYEAWFLAGIEALRRAGKIPVGARSARSPDEAEVVRGCKERLGALLGKPYEPTIHQLAFTESLPFTPGMARRSRSYHWLMKKLSALTRAARASSANRSRRTP